MTGADAVDVSTIIVNWNTRELLDACLRSLAAHVPAAVSHEVIVLDNGSTDGSADLVRQAWPDVTLIASPENLGYTRGNNVAIERSRGRHLLLINADAQLTAGCLEALLSRMDGDPRAAVVGPRLVYGDGSFQRWTAGRAPTLASCACYFLGLDRLGKGRRPALGVYVADDVRTAFRPDWVSSACMVVRRAALDEIGLMDETFFCYMDDVDLCQRARDAGWHVWYEPAATAVHLMGQSTKRQTGAASPAALRNFNRYFVREHGAAAGVALRLIEATGFGLRTAAYGVRGLVQREHRSSARNHWTHLKLSLERTDA